MTNDATVVEAAKSEVGPFNDSTHVEPLNESSHISLQEENQSSVSHCLLMLLQLLKKVYLTKRVSLFWVLVMKTSLILQLS